MIRYNFNAPAVIRNQLAVPYAKTVINKVVHMIPPVEASALVLSGILVLLYSLSPFRVVEKFVFPNQVETLVMVSYLSVFILLAFAFRLFKKVTGITFVIRITDILLFAYAINIGCRYLIQYQTIDPELVFEGFSLVVLYILFRSISKKTTACFLWVFPVVGIFQIAFGIKNQTGNFALGYGLSDVTGIFNNTGILGGFIAIVIVVTLGLGFNRFEPVILGNKKRFMVLLKGVTLFLICLFLLQLYFSGSRAAWLSCLAGILYIIFVKFNGQLKLRTLSRIKQWAIVGIFFCLTPLVLNGLYQYKKDSALGRLLIWQVSGDMISDKPFFGHGAGGFKANYMEYQAAYFQRNPDSSFGNLADDNIYAFNEFIRIWVEQGVMGLLLTALILFFLFFRARKLSNSSIPHNNVIVTVKASMLTLVVFGLFSYPTEVFQFNVMIVLFIAILSTRLPAIIHLNTGSATKNWNPLKGLVMVGIIALWLTLALVMKKVGSDYVDACKKWDFALKGFSEHNCANSISMLETGYPYLKNNGIYLATYGKVLTLSRQYNKAIQVLQRANCLLPSAANCINLGKCYGETGHFENAKAAWGKASYRMPSLFTPKYLMVKLLLDNGHTGEAMQIANELLIKKIKIESPEIDRMLDEMRVLIKTTDKKAK